MKKLWNFGKYILILGIGVSITYFILSSNGTKSISVRTIEPSERKVKQTVSASGEVKADKSASLSFPFLGKLNTLNFQKGDSVEKGDFLASLESSDDYYSLEAAQDSVDVAIHDRDLFVENYETNLQAAGGKDEYEIQLRKYNELIEKAKATYNSTKESYNNNFLYSPISGIVLDTYYKEGETITAGSPVIKIADPETLYFEVTLDQEDYGKIQEGQKAEIELDSYEDILFEGKVKKLPGYANGGATPNFIVEIEVLPGEKPALLGMTGDARIITDQTENQVMALLYDEIFTDVDDKPFVWTVNEAGNLKRHYVEIGIEGDLYTEIKSDLPPKIVVPLEDSEDPEEGFKATITNE